jgi:hypothetical protein
VVEDGVRVEVQADLVVLQDLRDDGWLAPRGASVLGGFAADVVVLVAVYGGWSEGELVLCLVVLSWWSIP